MPSESEAKLVHKEPEVPFILNGVLYQPEQIHLFDGQRLGFTIGENGILYAFLNYTVSKYYEKEENATLWESKISSLDLKMSQYILNQIGKTN